MVRRWTWARSMLPMSPSVTRFVILDSWEGPMRLRTEPPSAMSAETQIVHR